MSRLLLALALMLSAEAAWGFPDMIRHGYVNCTACHVAPSGGGLLTAYGRAMSKEVLSTWGGEREAEVLHGLLPEGGFPEWFLAGGDVRAIQVHRETPQKRQGSFFLMQAQVELGVQKGPLTAVLAVGEADPSNDSVRPTSRKHYVMWTPQDALSLRAGRFTPTFGLNVAYHTMPTRGALGFGGGLERQALEGMWSGEEWNMATSFSRSPPETTSIGDRESLVTVQVNRSFAGKYRVGASYLTGATSQSDREAYGVHALLGFSHRWAYLTEFTWQRVQAHLGDSSRGLYHFSQLIYEPTKGFQLYLLEDYQKTNLNDDRTLANALGPGARFFPRPHFAFDFVFLKKRVAAVADRYDDSAWLLTHYYF